MRIARVLYRFLIAASLFLAPTAGAEIYRWLDDQGQVHFGDCRPSECRAAEITPPVTPSEQRVEDARRRTEKLQEFLSDIAARRARESSDTAPAPETASDLSIPGDIDCFSPLQAAWQNRIDDSREEITRRPLSVGDRSNLKRLLNALQRRRHGTLETTACLSPDASPATELDGYQLGLDAGWESDRVFRLTAHLSGTTGRGKERRYLWFLLEPEGLRFRLQRAPTSFNLDEPRNDVETLLVTGRELVFYRRRGGRLRRVTIWVLKDSEARFELSSYHYVQGILAKKTHWRVDD